MSGRPASSTLAEIMPRQIRKSPFSLVVLGAVAGLSLTGCGRPADERDDTPVRKASSVPAKASLPSSTPEPATTTASKSAPAAEPSAPRPHPELDAALAVEDPGRRSQEFFPKFAALLNRDFAAALAYLRGMKRGPEFPQALMMVVDAAARRSADEALALAAELANTRDTAHICSALFDRFARENPVVAAGRLNAIPAGEARENALRAVADAWNRTDAAAALAWARALPDESDRTIALESILRGLALRDPARAIEEASKLLKAPVLERVLQTAFQQLANADPERAARLLENLPPGDAQTLVTMDVARALAMRDVPAALAWVKTLPIEFTQWLATTNILFIWGSRDLPAAARYVTELPPGGGLDYIAGQFANLMARQPKDGIAWAEALAGESARDAAFVTIASIWAQQSPAEAMTWAMGLQGEPLRGNTLAAAHSTWRAVNPAAAQAWLETAPLTPRAKARVLAPR